ncbi:hypothetical protein D7V86_24520 [bacterium D16-51]|nr:hypothetical protein D7V96_25665 [bacterium D16-59]RKI53898.1 hypothetical protein D7V86_24520 [bacterium D16-51]
MTKVIKDGITMAARDKNQLSAFLNNGWKEEGTKEPVITQPGGKSEYKKSDIAKMNVEDLKKLAAELQIEGAAGSTGDVLKAAIIERLGL